jgi:hypothetical protein
MISSSFGQFHFLSDKPTSIERNNKGEIEVALCKSNKQWKKIRMKKGRE